MTPLKIVFMGTPDFAVGILDKIITEKYNVAAVITAPDKPAGRGQQLKMSAVKEYALAKNLPVLQPTNLKDENFIESLNNIEANLFVVVAFRMLPEVVWKMPSLGTFNLHASLLPDYRGAAPINWAIINGETKTGVTTFFIDEKIDTGAMILSNEIEITPDDNAGTLHDKLMTLGSETVIETLELIKKGNVQPRIQTEKENLKAAPKLTRENCKIDFSKSTQEMYNLIRGLSPYPSAWCYLENNQEELMVKIYDSNFSIEKHNLEIGTFISSKKELKVATKDGFINFTSIQLPGKKKMTVSELLNGYKFSENARFK